MIFVSFHARFHCAIPIRSRQFCVVKNYRVFLWWSLLVSFCLNANGQKRNDVVIDEIMADPTPAVGLPGVEFIELFNRSSASCNLQGWRLSDGASTATIASSSVLKPDSFVILCSTSAAALFSKFGRAVGVSSFPSLDNSSGILILQNRDGTLIHSIRYDASWHENVLKKDGGWTLEMIDPENPCGALGNWSSSRDPLGGTPGRVNSVHGSNPDHAPPSPLRAIARDSTGFDIFFDESMDSLSLADPSHFNLPFTITGLQTLPGVVDKLFVKVREKIVEDSVYSIKMVGLKDCIGNMMPEMEAVPMALASTPVKGNVVINEMLFNPVPGGSDFIELYNASKRVINLDALFLTSRNTAGAFKTPTRISDEGRLLFQGQFALLTADTADVKSRFVVKGEGVVVQTVLPSMPDDTGNVVLLNHIGDITDEVVYSERWQFPLLATSEGVSLERISDQGSGTESGNWHSAASTAGFGTPGYKNSQFVPGSDALSAIMLESPVFSPDNDGFQDVLVINFHFNTPGVVCRMQVIDLNGRTVRVIAANAVCGITGSFTWDGLDEQGKRLPVGQYVILTDAFTVTGDRHRYKQSVAIAARWKN